jgi:alcohol dehydrogenase
MAGGVWSTAGSVPQLLKLVQARRFDPTVLATHTFALREAMAACDTFGRAGQTGALRVVLKR